VTPFSQPTTVANPLEAGLQQAALTVGVEVMLATPPAIEVVAQSCEEFISRLAKHTASILSAPAAVNRPMKKKSAGQMPRRSCRIEGIQVEFNLNELERRFKKKTMCNLEVITEHEGVSPQALEDYEKIFGQPLSGRHLEALAALFNWALPDLGVLDVEQSMIL
jgi:hypothetical protein